MILTLGASWKNGLILTGFMVLKELVHRAPSFGGEGSFRAIECLAWIELFQTLTIKTGIENPPHKEPVLKKLAAFNSSISF